jgi:hypothetical protein
MPVQKEQSMHELLLKLVQTVPVDTQAPLLGLVLVPVPVLACMTIVAMVQKLVPVLALGHK